MLKDIEGVFDSDANAIINNLEINNYTTTNIGEVNNITNNVTFTMNVVINNDCCGLQPTTENDEYYDEQDRLYHEAIELDRKFVTRYW